MKKILFLIIIISIFYNDGNIMAAENNDIDNIKITLDTTSKNMTLYQIVGEIRKQIGDTEKKKLMVGRILKDSTQEIHININNLKLPDALEALAKKYNLNKKCPSPYMEERHKYDYLRISKENNCYILKY